MSEETISQTLPMIPREQLTDRDLVIAVRPSETDPNQVSIVLAGEEPDTKNVAYFVGIGMMVFLSENSEAFQKRYGELLREWAGKDEDGVDDSEVTS